MKLTHDVPCANGTDRARQAKEVRDLCTEVARLRPHATTWSNREETDFAPACFPSNFTKGLKHNQYGVVEETEDYRAFVEAINSDNPNLFESSTRGAADRMDPQMLFKCTGKFPEPPPKPAPAPTKGPVELVHRKPDWRGWESPRAGHVFELEGPDPGAVGMAPAPRVYSSELAAEMAEVYALALLRDVRFTDICSGTSKAKLCEGGAEAILSSQEIVELLNAMSFYSGGPEVVSSTPLQADSSRFNAFERRRRFARTQDDSAPYTAALTPQTAFRGSTSGALVGPYVSQFMLVGSRSLAGAGNTLSSFPGLSSKFDLIDGFIPYGSLVVDQRTVTHKACLDHMTDWASWLDVQNGADFRGKDLFECQRRFITTPRDLATYVHYDALYEAYLNAALTMIGLGVPVSKGFPEASVSGRRTGFATFGGPHILSLVTEVATRCLKAVRRQKFNYHRRARPEAIAGRLTLVQCGLEAQLGCAAPAFAHALGELPPALVEAVIAHNREQNHPDMWQMRLLKCDDAEPLCDHFDDCNLLLPMAFPEGSPMHPAYGAGHATVAGGCVTMLKAFFEMFESHDETRERPLCDKDGQRIVYVPDANGGTLEEDSNFSGTLTIQGELDKLAANIAIGRNMAGVHYYTDYYDSLRMGERVAVGILLEQAATYGEPIESTFTSFDGDFISISGQEGTAPSLTVIDRQGNRVATRDWWLRHVVGEDVILDLA